MIDLIIPAPSLLSVQLDTLRAAFPDWIITVARFGSDSWFEATRPGYAGRGPCALVAGSAATLWRGLSQAKAAE